MLIKYKGNTSSMLKDLSLELKMPLDLKVSEEVLKCFWGTILRNLDQERYIELIIALPPFLKPFCNVPNQTYLIQPSLFSESQKAQSVAAIMRVLSNYMSQESFKIISLCLPESFSNAKKEVEHKAYAA